MLAGQAVQGLPTAARRVGKTTVAFPTRPAIRSFKQLVKSQETSSLHHTACRRQKATSAAARDSVMASNAPVRRPRRGVTTHATPAVQASYASSDSSKASLTPVLLAVAIASLGALLFGLHVAVVNGLQDAVSKELGFYANTGLRGAVSTCPCTRACRTTAPKYAHLSAGPIHFCDSTTPVLGQPSQNSALLTAFCLLQMVSTVLAGATIGSTSGSGLADGLGRRKSFLLAAVPLVLGSILCATAASATALLAGRFLCGVGIGLTSAVTPVYISEVRFAHVPHLLPLCLQSLSKLAFT